MIWPLRVWRRLSETIQRYNGDGMEGLWLVSEDLRTMTDNLACSRKHLNQSQQAKNHAVRHLEHTIEDLKKKTSMPFKVNTSDDDD